jgi:hypothetical protein
MLGVVEFRAEVYGNEVAGILVARGGGNREMPLTRSGCVAEPAREALAAKTAQGLFPHSRTPEAALSGLYLYLGCWDEAHAHSGADESAENYFWHAIVHRQEPDAWNSGYWFRKTGAHPVFPRLADEAERAGYAARRPWDPIAFVDYCETARRLHSSEEERSEKERSEEERLARRVQLIEWQLLFDYSARESRH